MLLKTASGKICQISNSRRATYGYDQRIEVHGSKGLLSAGNVHETTVSFAGAGGVTADPGAEFLPRALLRRLPQRGRCLHRCGREGKKPSPDGNDGLRAQMLADAATEVAPVRQAGKGG